MHPPKGRPLVLALALLAIAAAGAISVIARKATAPAAVASAGDAMAPPTQGADGYWRISFNDLTDFAYTLPGVDSLAPTKPVAGRVDGIPEDIQQLEGRPVRFEGYMLPLAMEKDGSVKEFLAIQSVQTCCYGATPAPTEWVVVKLGPKSPKVKATMDVPLVFSGKFHVGEIYRDGLFAGIYELELDRVAHP